MTEQASVSLHVVPMSSQMVVCLQGFSACPPHVVTPEPQVTLVSEFRTISTAPPTHTLEDALPCENLVDLHYKILHSLDSFLITYHHATKLQRAAPYWEQIPHFLGLFFFPL